MAERTQIESKWREIRGKGHAETPPGEIYSGAADLSVGQLEDYIKSYYGMKAPGGENIAELTGQPYFEPPTTTTAGAVSTEDLVEKATEIAKGMWKVGKEFRDPALKTLKGGYEKIPGLFDPTREAIKAEREPTKQRYQSLLEEVARRETEAEKLERMATAKEFSRRGIPLTSGVYEQELSQALQPISAQYAGMATTVGQQREESLRKLTSMLGGLSEAEAQATLDLDQAIAAVQAAGAPGAVTAATNLLSQQQQAQQAAAQLALDQYLAEQQAQQFALQWPTQKALTEAKTGYYETPEPTIPGMSLEDVWGLTF